LKPLDELTVRGCDLHVFFVNFLEDPTKLRDLEPPFTFPQINELTILHLLVEDAEMERVDAIVELEKLQHALVIPFGRVKVRMWGLPSGMMEELGRWVDAVDCREELYKDDE
jgi:hypothetical protein